MKTFCAYLVVMGLVVSGGTLGIRAASAESLDEAFQSALMAEEGRRDLAAAIRGYEEVVARVDAQRALAATAVFRLGECYRKLGRAEDAVRQYQRVVQDFPSESVLVRLSRENLKALGVEEKGVGAAGAGVGGIMLGGPSAGTGVAGSMSREQWRLLEERLRMLRAQPDGEEFRAMVRTWFPDPLLERLEMQLMEKVQLARQGPAVDPDTGHRNEQHVALQKEVNELEVQLMRQVRGILLAQELTLEAIKAVRLSEAGGGDPVAAVSTGPVDEEEMEIARLALVREQSPDRLNAPGEGGLTPLGKAARSGQLDVVDRLLSWGVDPLRKMERGEDQVEGLTALHLAAREGHREVVLRFLMGGVNPNLASQWGTPLSLAVAREFTGVVELLLERGADPKAEGFAYSLAAAIDADSPRMVERMVQAGAGMSSLGGAEGKAPLERALATNRREAARALIRLGSPVGEGMLERALKFDGMDAEWLGELLKAAPGELKASGGLDRLLVSVVVATEGDRVVRSGPSEFPPVNAELAAVLLQAGASPNACLPETQEPVIIFVTRRGHPAFDTLLAAGPDLSMVTPDGGGTVLHAAIGQFEHSLDWVQRLLEAGADPNVRDAAQLTPLAYVEDAMRRESRSSPPSLADKRLAQLAQLRDQLMKAGARQDVTRRSFLSVKRGNDFERFFVRRAEDAVPLRLAELLTVIYSRNRTRVEKMSLHFPALDQLRIHRWAEDGSHEYVVPVASDWVKQEGCDWNVALEWGDALEIPEDLDRPATAQWKGLSQDVVDALQKCTVRQVTVEVEGVAQKWKLLPLIAWLKVGGNPGEGTLYSAYLDQALTSTRQLRASSDLSRVRVTRPGTGQEWILDLTPGPMGPMSSGAFWLLDGDRIVVPSKQP